MPKGPKYKKGFTFRHHFDEWWDRRPHEWKVRLIVFLGFMALVGAAAALFWGHRWMEREELMTEAKRLHEKRIQEMDSRLISETPAQPPPLTPPPVSLEIRPGE